MSIDLTIVVFIGNLCLCFLGMYFYHRFAIFKKLSLSFLKDGKQKFSLKPIVTTMAGNDILKENSQRLDKKFMILTKENMKKLIRNWKKSLAQVSPTLTTKKCLNFRPIL